MAAGFAGLFPTPLAATVFALEVLAAGRLRYEALAPALAASLVASATSGALGLAKFEVAVAPLAALDAPATLRLALAGLAFGVAGGAFAWLLSRGKSVAARLLPNPVVRAAAMGVGQDVLPWDWILKLALTVLTLSAGYQGGEVTPLFSIGACLGMALAGPLGLPVALAVALGYAAVFGAATNTFLASLLIGGEVFGWANLPAFFVVCAAAYLFNMGKTIYAGQLPG